MDRPTRATIIATLGPASSAPELVARLVEAGVGVFRLNFSHGSFDDHARRLGTIREVCERLGSAAAVLGDLQGPKIRVGAVPEPGIALEAGFDVLFRRAVETAGLDGTTAAFGTTYEQLIDEVEPGQRVLINDGAVRMIAVERGADELRCRVTVGGLVTTGKGINLPETDVRAPAITERDWRCVEWAVEHGLDFLALSFVRTPDEVLELKRRLAGMCGVSRADSEDESTRIPVVAKIEKPQALDNIEAIVGAADAVMVARGDLGVEMDIARTPIAQKRIVSVAQRFGKPCIVATQMLESMIDAATPTRAEASDVANAVLDGADAVMLSGETAVGKHPALVVETMRRIVSETEHAMDDGPVAATPPIEALEARDRTAALAHGAWHVANDLGAVAVVCWSQRGNVARYLSQNDFRAPILAWCSSPRWSRRMALLRNVTPVCADPPPDGHLATWTDMVERDLLERGWVKHADRVVLVAGPPLGQTNATNAVAVLTVGDPRGGFRANCE